MGAQIDAAKLCELCPPDFEEGIVDAPPVDACSFVPLEKHQRPFLDTSGRRPALITGIGTGKTTTGAKKCFDFSVLANPEAHVGIIGAPTFSMLMDATLPKVREVFPAEILAGGSWDTAWHGQRKTLTLATGTVILARSMDSDNHKKVRSIEAAWAWLDEPGLLKSKDAWDTVCGRVRAKCRMRGAWATMTPNGENWAASAWVTDPRDGYEYWHATIYDNPYIPKDYIEDLENSYSEAWKRQELLGEIVSMRGAVFAELSDALWPAGNVLVYDPLKLRPTRLEIDFGFRHPAVQAVQSVEVVHPETGAPHQLDVVVWELQGRGRQPPTDLLVDEWLDIIQATGFQISMVYGDPAGDAHNDQTHMPSARIVRERLRVGFKKPTKPWQRNKQRGEEVVRGRIKSANGERRLVWAASPEVDRRGKHVLLAPNSFRSFRNLQYPDRADGRSEANESLKDGVNDHATDAARYRMVMEYGTENIHRLWTPKVVMG